MLWSTEAIFTLGLYPENPFSSSSLHRYIVALLGERLDDSVDK